MLKRYCKATIYVSFDEKYFNDTKNIFICDRLFVSCLDFAILNVKSDKCCRYIGHGSGYNPVLVLKL